jgi:hypothetical protein
MLSLVWNVQSGRVLDAWTKDEVLLVELDHHTRTSDIRFSRQNKLRLALLPLPANTQKR